MAYIRSINWLSVSPPVSITPYLSFSALGSNGITLRYCQSCHVSSFGSDWSWRPTCTGLLPLHGGGKSRMAAPVQEERGFKITTLAGWGPINRPYLPGDITSGLTKVNWKLFSPNCVSKRILWCVNAAHNQKSFMGAAPFKNDYQPLDIQGTFANYNIE